MAKATQSAPLKAGIIGCGNISGAYLNHAKTFESMRLVACADLNAEVAKGKADEFGLEAVAIDALLAREDIDLILNLTTPQAHAPVNLQALKAGKHVYCEKPFALSMDEADEVLRLAEERGLRVGCAPDTFLGGGIQTCRKLIDDGWIGTPVAGTAFMMCPGHESWHPNPGFYYLQGGGPLLDMGPYYITALVNLLGPVAEVQAMAHMSGERTCTCEARRGEVLPVEVDTHVTGTLRFKQGAAITLIMSFDVTDTIGRNIEVHGTDGSIHVPDPNTFGGPVSYARRNGDGLKEAPLTHGYADNMRGIGLADMAQGIISDRPHRASGELAAHVLEVMLALGEASKSKGNISIKSVPSQPAAMAGSLTYGSLD